MSNNEKQLYDSGGKFALAVKDDRQLNNISWTECRVLLSNKRLILACGDNKKTITLSSIESIEGREDSTQSIAAMSNYLSLRIDNDVIVITTNSYDEFELAFYNAVIDKAVIRVKHPAVEGGVVQGTSWVKGRVSVEESGLMVALKSGSLAELELEEITQLSRERQAIQGSKRLVLQVSHVDEGTSIETHITASERKVRFIETFLREGEEQNELEVDLSPKEEEVLMALYSGVSPFVIPEFTGQDVETVEETYDKLLELDVVDMVRERHEVALNSRGRNIASEAMSSE